MNSQSKAAVIVVNTTVFVKKFPHMLRMHVVPSMALCEVLGVFSVESTVERAHFLTSKISRVSSLLLFNVETQCGDILSDNTLWSSHSPLARLIPHIKFTVFQRVPGKQQVVDTGH